MVTHLWLFFPSALTEIPRSAFRETLQRILSPPTGNVAAEPSEVIAVCQSLQRVAEKCQLDPESCWYFHQTAIPCLLALAVQASMPGNFLHLTSYLSPLVLRLPLVNSTATLRFLLVLHFIPAEAYFKISLQAKGAKLANSRN